MTAEWPPVRLPDQVSVVNVGLPRFADAVREQVVPVQQVDWRIPAGGDLEVVEALELLYGERADTVDRANAEVVRRLDHGNPQLEAVGPARELVPALTGRMLLHCGPAVSWPEVCDPLRRSLRAATVAEGWAGDVEQADRLLSSGAVPLEPAYRHDVVLPMAGSIGPSAPLFVVSNRAGRTRAMAPVNQGPGDTAWFGRETPAAVQRLRFIRDVAGPLLQDLLRHSGPIDLFALAAQGVQMGDDVHLRTQATTNLLLRELLPHVASLPDDGRVALARFLAGNHMFFLNLAMAAAKSVAVWAADVEGSSIVTLMCRNGTTFGIRLAGSDRLFLAEAPPVRDAMYLTGYGPEDAAPDIGDSAILELVGLGAAAAAGSPAVAGFLGGRMADAAAVTEEMRLVCSGESTRFKLPTRDNAGTPLGVDVRRVVELGVTPRVTTGILHRSSGAGQVGAGVASAPVGCFRAAVLHLAEG
jgi:hypothetical protein